MAALSLLWFGKPQSQPRLHIPTSPWAALIAATVHLPWEERPGEPSSRGALLRPSHFFLTSPCAVLVFCLVLLQSNRSHTTLFDLFLCNCHVAVSMPLLSSAICAKSHVLRRSFAAKSYRQRIRHDMHNQASSPISHVSITNRMPNVLRKNRVL